MWKRLLLASLLVVPAGGAIAAGLLIEQLGSAGPLSSADKVPVVQGSSPAKQTTVGGLGDFLAGRVETLTNKTIDCTSGNNCVLPANGGGGPTTPTTTTTNFIPQWGNTTGSSLTTGLPVATSGASTIIETDATGHVLASALPLPGATTVGAVEAFTAPANQFLTAINTDGSVSAAQPNFGNIAGQLTFAQFPTMAADRLLGTTSAGVPTQIPFPSTPCDGSNQAINWSGTAAGCATFTFSGIIASGPATTGDFLLADNTGGTLTTAQDSGVSVTDLATLNGHAVPLGGSLTLGFSDLSGTATFAQLPAVTGPTIIGRTTATSGPLSGAYIPSNGTDTTVPMVHGATAATHCAEFSDATGTLIDAGVGCGGGSGGGTSWAVQGAKSAGYTVIATDAGTIIPNSGAAITWTLPTNTSCSVFPAQQQFILQNTGSDIDTINTVTSTIGGVPSANSGTRTFLPGNGSAILFTIDASCNYQGVFLPSPAPSLSTAGANFTLSIGSCLGVTYNVTANITVTIPTGLPPGCHVEFDADGGIPTLAAGSGFTLTSPHGFTKASANGASIAVSILSSTTGVFQGDGA